VHIVVTGNDSVGSEGMGRMGCYATKDVGRVTWMYVRGNCRGGTSGMTEATVGGESSLETLDGGGRERECIADTIVFVCEVGLVVTITYGWNAAIRHQVCIAAVG
jgi:hypothetical protein